MCARYFFFKVSVSPTQNNPRDTFVKPSSKYPLFFKHIWNSVRFLKNVERDEFGIRRRKASPFANSVFTPLSV